MARVFVKKVGILRKSAAFEGGDPSSSGIPLRRLCLLALSLPRCAALRLEEPKALSSAVPER